MKLATGRAPARKKGKLWLTGKSENGTRAKTPVRGKKGKGFVFRRPKGET